MPRIAPPPLGNETAGAVAAKRLSPFDCSPPLSGARSSDRGASTAGVPIRTLGTSGHSEGPYSELLLCTRSAESAIGELVPLRLQVVYVKVSESDAAFNRIEDSLLSPSSRCHDRLVFVCPPGLELDATCRLALPRGHRAAELRLGFRRERSLCCWQPRGCRTRRRYRGRPGSSPGGAVAAALPGRRHRCAL